MANDYSLSSDSADASEQSIAPAPSQPVDYTNQMISQPYLGKINPQEVLQSPDTTLEEKEQALQVINQKQAEQEAQKAQLAEQEMGKKALSYNAWQDANSKFNTLAEQAKSKGIKISLPERPDPAKFGLNVTDIAEFSNPETQQKSIQPAKQVALDDAHQKEDLFQQQLSSLGEKQAKREQTMMDGYMAEQEAIAQKRQKLMSDQIAMVEKEQTDLDQIDPNRFWNNLSTGDRIKGTIAIAMGEIGRALTKSDRNNALNIINDAIERDVSAQKLNNDQKLSLKANALKRAALEIEKYAEMSKDSTRKFEMQKYADALNQQREALKQQQALARYKQNVLLSEGMDKAEFEQLATDNERARAVSLPNGKVALATNADTSQKLNTAIAKNVAAEDLTNQLLKEMQGFGNADKFTPQVFSQKRQRIEDLRQSLIGALREPVTGPGVLSETERKILSEMVVDPSKLLVDPGLAIKRIEGLKRTLQSLKNASYQNAGINIGLDPRQQAIDNYTIYAIKNGKDPEAVARAISNKSK